MTEYQIWERYTVLGHSISQLTVRERRHIFHTVRTVAPTGVDPSPDMFFPAYGFTLGEFATFQVLLADTRRKRNHGGGAAGRPSSEEVPGDAAHE